MSLTSTDESNEFTYALVQILSIKVAEVLVIHIGLSIT